MDTIGDASVRPYPSDSSSPKRSRIRSATPTGNRAAPDEPRRTVAKASAGASSKWANALHIDGTPGTAVTLRAWMDSMAVAGSKRCTSSSVPPAASVNPSVTLSPKMWYSGSTP